MGEYSPYARYQPPYATVPMGLVRLLVAKGVGRNGWAVIAALCCGVHENGVLDVRSAASVCEMTGLTRNQVARGMAELRERGVIVAVARRNARGYLHPDRSNFGHVAQYCFTREAWRAVCCEWQDAEAMAGRCSAQIEQLLVDCPIRFTEHAEDARCVGTVHADCDDICAVGGLAQVRDQFVSHG